MPASLIPAAILFVIAIVSIYGLIESGTTSRTPRRLPVDSPSNALSCPSTSSDSNPCSGSMR